MTTKKGESFKDIDEKRNTEELPEPFARALSEIAEMKVATAPLIKEYKVLGKPLPQILDEMDDNIRAAADAARKAEEAARAAKEAAGFATKASTSAEKRAEAAKKAGQLAAKIATKAAADAGRKAEETAKAARLAAQEATINAEKSLEGAKSATEAFRKAAEESVFSIANETTKAKKYLRSLRAHETSLSKRVESLEERLATMEASLTSKKVIILREISKKDAEKEICKLFSEGKVLYYSDIAENLGLDLKMVVDICDKLQKRGVIEIDANVQKSR